MKISKLVRDNSVGMPVIKGNSYKMIHRRQVLPSNSDFILTATAIIKTAIGSGILALPYTVSKLGVIFSIMVFAIAIALFQFSAIILLKAKNLSAQSSYPTILYFIFKTRKAKAFGSIFITLGNLGICIAEFIIMKKTVFKMIVDLLPADSASLNEFYTNQLFVALIIAIVEAPFLWAKKIEKLKFMAFIGVMGLILFTITFQVHYVMASVDDNIDVRPVGGMAMFPENWLAAIAAIPNVIYALSFIYNFYPIYKGMRNATDHKMKVVTLFSTIACSVIYLTIGILGYNLIGSSVNGNFLESLLYKSTNHIIYFIINASFLFCVCLTFPIVFFGCRSHFIVLIDCFFSKSQDQEEVDEQQSVQFLSVNEPASQIERKRSRLPFIIKTMGVYGVIVAVSMLTDDITVVFNAIGAICSTSNLIFLPYSFYILLIRKKDKPRKMYFYVAVIIFMIMIPFAVFSIVAKYIHL